ncbi:MAG: HAMP domain-containing histidine kinase, partial [Dehalococcoidia bacterium]|nr:HAMP domain-containing histidine kinase [Dehalococcoidia bacterium]
RHPDQTVEANVDQVAAINEESDHLGRLVGDLLTLARADEERLGLVHEAVDLDDLLDALVRDMTALAEAKRVALTGDLHGGRVEGDPQRLRQLATILIDNALKFTPPGGSVRVRAWREGSRVAFSVSDTGPGVSAADQPRIFDRFFRSDEARSPEGGTGLGLAIARTIAEAHHGRIGVESVPGNGATFSVRLPRK